MNKCPICKANVRRVRGSDTAVFCPECGWTYKNGDKKFRALGRPPKAEAGTDKQANRPATEGS
jgi:ribosomal protein L37AE/L43A